MSRITRDIEVMTGVRHSSWTGRGAQSLTKRLKRHPIPVAAHFRHSLVLTYAFPEEVLKPLLPPGLLLDTYEGLGFVAIAMVQTEGLRPAFLPRCFGQNFFLTGYRIFARYRNRDGRLLRGLRILRSDTDRRFMAVFGNLLTHYNYQTAEVEVVENADELKIDVATAEHAADLRVIARIGEPSAALPEHSPFPTWHEARLFAGPLPFTFDYEADTHSLVLIEGVRRHWNPKPVAVDVTHCRFFESEPFKRVTPRLANAFYVANIDYRWNRGVVEALGEKHPLTPAFV
jgi:uncharacterized protein YqjF (DUF2071 family)